MYCRQKDNYTVFDTDRITVYSDDLGNTKMSIRNLRPDDSGLYFCIAENEHGKAKCAATLKVVGKYGVIRGLKSVAGYYEVSLLWSGVPGKDKPFEHERKQAQIPDIKPKEYTPFKLKEWSPTRRREHSPIQTREYSPIRRRKFSPTKFDDKDFADEFERPSRPKKTAKEPMEVTEPVEVSKKPTEEAAPVKKGVKPSFVQVPPAEISVHEGEPLTLRCVVDGEPKPIGKPQTILRLLLFVSVC